MKIAVIGSGIGGLAATWFLRRHDVTLFERASTIGMDNHTTEVDGDGARVPVNVPMRVFFEAYYPTLTALYRELGVAYEAIEYSGSFGDFEGRTYFRYRNFEVGGRSRPMLAGGSWRSATAIRTGLEILRFGREWPKLRRDPEVIRELDEMPLETYLRRKGYSRHFAERFLYPAFAGICTCSLASVRRYPASLILEYVGGGLMQSRVNRLVDGTRDAAKRLASAATDIRLGQTLHRIALRDDGVEIGDREDAAERFDHVVIATQANHAIGLLPDNAREEARLLRRFRYEASRVVVHRDTRLAPRRRRDWAPVNFLLSPERDKPMASIWLNRIHPELQDEPALFETWNPYVDLAPADVLVEATFERPVVTLDSLQATGELETVQRDPKRRMWFCGSYASRGIPLLESAVASARAIAERIEERAIGRDEAAA